MIRCTFIILFVFAGAAARADDPAAKQAKKLQGEWQVVEGERNGKKATRESAEIKDMRFVFKENELGGRRALPARLLEGLRRTCLRSTRAPSTAG